MEISAAKFTKAGIASKLVLGMSSQNPVTQYFVLLDDVVLTTSTNGHTAQRKFVEARAGLISCGWKLDTTPAFTGR